MRAKRGSGSGYDLPGAVRLTAGNAIACLTLIPDHDFLLKLAAIPPEAVAAVADRNNLA